MKLVPKLSKLSKLSKLDKIRFWLADKIKPKQTKLSFITKDEPVEFQFTKKEIENNKSFKVRDNSIEDIGVPKINYEKQFPIPNIDNSELFVVFDSDKVDGFPKTEN